VIAPRRNPVLATAGFTLIEAMLGILLVGIILGALATVTGQWLPNWSRGMLGLQRVERIAVSVQRMISDISGAEMIAPEVDSKTILFDGTQHAITFVRTAVGPNAKPGLEIVRLSENVEDQGLAMTRQHAVYAPMPPDTRIRFADPVVLIRTPYRVYFSYAGPDGVWQQDWRSQPQLPQRIQISIRDTSTGRRTSFSEAALVHVNASAECAHADNPDECISPKTDKDTQPGADAKPEATR
jgi:general secretion pathway protein J